MPELIRIDKFIIQKYGSFTSERLRLVTWANRERWNGDSWIPDDFIAPREGDSEYQFDFQPQHDDVFLIAEQFPIPTGTLPPDPRLLGFGEGIFEDEFDGTFE